MFLKGRERSKVTRGAVLLPAPAVLLGGAGTPLPTPAWGTMGFASLQGGSGCGKANTARVEPFVLTKHLQIAAILGHRCS